MKIVYVTGCLGFIGSHITRECLKRGWKVFGVDKETYVANTSLLKEFNLYDNFRYLKADIKDLDFLYDCDYVINTAAESHVGNSIIDSKAFMDSNVLGTKNLLDLIRNKPSNVVKRPILLHFSTDEVYGDIVNGEHHESDVLRPSNPYSAAKACSDMLILAWARTYNLEYIIVRPTNNYGIGQYPEKLIPLSVKQLMRGNKIQLHNNGTPIRNWLHVEDTVAAIMSIVESRVTNEIFNISGGFEQQNLETVKKIINSFYEYDLITDQREYEKHIDLSYSRQGQDVRYAINDNKLRKLGWKPTKVFDQQIESIVNYYKNRFIW